MVIRSNELGALRKRNPNAKIVLGSGCFDLLHPGHLEFIRLARSFGDVLVVAVLSDRKVKERKGPTRPIMDETTRVSMINAIQGVDYAFVEPYSLSVTRASLMKIIESLQPDVFIHNDDNDSWESFRERMKHHGTELQFMQASKINSTTGIIERIRYIHGHKDHSKISGEAIV